MPATGREFGLEVNDNVDERYHIEKATVAACKYFKQAYAKYGDWMAVSAAYNAGQGRISSQLDKQLARKTKGSNNHAKTRLLKAKTHGRIRNQRRDMAYKLASKVAGENQAVALETLNVKGLARTRMAKSLLDANWTRIIDRIRQLGIQYGRTIVQIDRWYPSSQICSHCGRRDGRKMLDIREWECTDCGAFLDRDWNAALNILDAAGLAESLNARGGDVRRRLAQAGRNADAREAGTRRTVSLH